MMIKDIADKILSIKIKPYIKYDTATAKQHYFMCIFSESYDFGINILNANVELVVGYLEKTDSYILDKMKTIITDEIGYYEEVLLIYFFLYHEEGHWLEFLESGLDSITYCKSIDLSGYKGSLTNIRKELNKDESNRKALSDKYDWQYRSNPYEQRADAYALKKLKEYLDK